MDTLSATPTPDADARLVDLERQLAELRAQFRAMTFGLEPPFAAGRASITNPRAAAPRRSSRHCPLGSTCELVGGGEQ